MNVYLAPLVDELKVLWEGINVQDVSRRTRLREVNLKGILMWTMHDFPGFGECSGVGTNGYPACPHCGPSINARYSKSLKKMICEGHKIFLPEENPLREGFLGRAPKCWSISYQHKAWHKNLGSYGMK